MIVSAIGKGRKTKVPSQEQAFYTVHHSNSAPQHATEEQMKPIFNKGGSLMLPEWKRTTTV